MRKTIIVLTLAMTAMLCVILAGCGGGGEDLADSKYVGTWKAVSMSLGDEEESLEDREYVLTLNDDGTGTFEGTADDGTRESSELTWELTDGGFKTSGDVKMKFNDDGERIQGKIIGVNINFEKQ